MYGTTVRTLFDSRAIPNVMSAELFQSLHLQLVVTSQRIRMANVTEAHGLGEIKDVSISIDEITKCLACLFVADTPFDLILEGPATKILCASLDFNQDVAVFKSESLAVRVPLWTDTGRHDSVVSKEFTSEEDGYGSGAESSESRRDSKKDVQDFMLYLLEEVIVQGSITSEKRAKRGSLIFYQSSNRSFATRSLSLHRW